MVLFVTALNAMLWVCCEGNISRIFSKAIINSQFPLAFKLSDVEAFEMFLNLYDYDFMTSKPIEFTIVIFSGTTDEVSQGLSGF